MKMPLAFDPARVRALVLRANLRAARIAPLTRRRLERASRRGALRVEGDGSLVLDVDGHAIGRPLLEPELEAIATRLRKDSVLVVVGLGTGASIEQLCRLSDVPVIVYEPHLELARTVLEWGPIDFRGACLVSSAVDLAWVWARLSGQRSHTIVSRTPGYDALFPAQADAAVEAVRRVAERASITRNTLDRRARTWVNDILANVALIPDCPPVMALEGRYPGVPAFIVGAGPSLDQNASELARAAKKGIVIAVNSAVPALAKHGIVPHAVVCMESIDVSHKLRGVPFMNECLRIMSLSAHPATLRANEGPLMLFHESIPQYDAPLAELTGSRGVNVCGSVSTAAFSIASALGCDPIVLVGQDLAYTGNRTYARGTGYETSTVRQDGAEVRFEWNGEMTSTYGTQHGPRHESEPCSVVPAWGERDTVLSSSSFLAIAAWLRSNAEVAREHGSRQHVNATEGGAHIEGFADRRLGELLDELPDLEVLGSELYAEAERRRLPVTKQAVRSWAEAHVEKSARASEHARAVARLGRRALSSMRGHAPESITRAFARLEHAERALRAAVKDSAFVDAWSHAAVEPLLRRSQSSAVRENASAARQGLALGTRLAQAIEVSARELHQAFQTLAHELDESANTTKGNSPCR